AHLRGKPLVGTCLLLRAIHGAEHCRPSSHPRKPRNCWSTRTVPACTMMLLGRQELQANSGGEAWAPQLVCFGHGRQGTFEATAAVDALAKAMPESLVRFDCKEPGPFRERYLDGGSPGSLVMVCPGTGNKGVTSTEWTDHVFDASACRTGAGCEVRLASFA